MYLQNHGMYQYLKWQEKLLGSNVILTSSLVLVSHTNMGK